MTSKQYLRERGNKKMRKQKRRGDIPAEASQETAQEQGTEAHTREGGEVSPGPERQPQVPEGEAAQEAQAREADPGIEGQQPEMATA